MCCWRGEEFGAAPILERVEPVVTEGAPSLAGQHHVALWDLNLSWQALLEKASRGNRIFLSEARSVSPLLLQTTGCVLPGRKSASWPWLRSPQPAAGSPQPTAENSQMLHVLLPSGSACPSAGLWILGLYWKVSAHIPSARMRIVERREELGFESRGPGHETVLPHKATVSTKWKEVGTVVSQRVSSPDWLPDLGNITPFSLWAPVPWCVKWVGVDYWAQGGSF